jgi:Holliday junction DNA helicase RuvA
MVSNPEDFEVGKVTKIYVHKNLTLNNKNHLLEEMYGFCHYEKKDLFRRLLTVSGIGCKTAIFICSNDVNIIKQAIINKDVETLTSLPGITPKNARIICEELEFTNEEKSETNDYNHSGELIKALKTLGYSKNEIDYAVKSIDFTAKAELSDLISNAIKIIAKGSTIVNEPASN